MLVLVEFEPQHRRYYNWCGNDNIGNVKSENTVILIQVLGAHGFRSAHRSTFSVGQGVGQGRCGNESLYLSLTRRVAVNAENSSTMNMTIVIHNHLRIIGN